MATEFKNENKVVLGIFRDRTSLESAVDSLKNFGFRNSDISALLPSTETTKEFAHENSTKFPEGATTGGVAGGLFGGTLGWLVGAGSVVIPGLGAFIAAGPIMAMLAGAAVGSTVGGLAGGLIGAGIPEFEAKRYEGIVKAGGYLVSVHCDNSEWVNKAKTILKDSGGEEISSVDEATSDSHKEVRDDIPREVGRGTTTARPY